MKRLNRISAIILALVIALALPVNVVLASNTTYTEFKYIYDYSDILTYDEWVALEQMAEDIEWSRGCGVYVITIDDFHDYAYNVEDACEYVVDYLGLGANGGEDKIVLFLSMEERDYCLLRRGAGDAALTEFGKSELVSRFRDNFSENDWYGGLYDYLVTCDEFLKMANEGKPYTSTSDGSYVVFSLVVAYVIAFVIGFAIAYAICARWKYQMQTARIATIAHEYVPDGGVEITHRNDRFRNMTTSRVKIESSSSGGGGSRMTSSGNRVSSGKF